ncbi:MAG: hypothetical protein IPJ00_09630 [Saprospirales bacterium]|nr:hypothetical protein [Saprospirales bacterium]
MHRRHPDGDLEGGRRSGQYDDGVFDHHGGTGYGRSRTCSYPLRSRWTAATSLRHLTLLRSSTLGWPRHTPRTTAIRIPELAHSFDGDLLDICAAADYVITVTWTANDACGNETILSSTITVVVDDVGSRPIRTRPDHA